METLQRTANRGSISTGYDIDNSLKLENDAAEQLYYTPSSAGNLQTWTYSCWFKRTELSYNMMLFGANDTYVYLEADDTLKLRFTGTYVFDTYKEFRDTSAWYHIVVAVDTTQATEADRVKVYFNGEDHAGLFENDSFPAQNTNTDWNNTLVHYVAGWGTASFNPSCYLAEVHNVDGQQLAATEFGEFDEDTGIWKPKAYTGSYGTNGFFLEFQNSADLGEVSAGTQQTFVKNNITSADQATDTPTNNFCIYNPRADFRQRDLTGFKNGCTQITHTDEGQWCGGVCTMGVTRGKWYWEIQQYDFDDILLGVHTFTGDVGSNTNPHNIDNCWYYYGGGASGSYWANYINGSGTSNSANRGTVWSGGNIIGFALNLDDDEFTFYVNGGSAGASNTNVDISSLTALGLPLIPFIGMWRSSVNLNFGGFTMTSISSGNTDENGYGNFEYAPPTGYYALCTKNLAEFG